MGFEDGEILDITQELRVKLYALGKLLPCILSVNEAVGYFGRCYMKTLVVPAGGPPSSCDERLVMARPSRVPTACTPRLMANFYCKGPYSEYFRLGGPKI